MHLSGRDFDDDYHFELLREEELDAQILFGVLLHAARRFPGCPRAQELTVENRPLHSKSPIRA
jgi:hypothetical protein